jgi:xylitol oxidase
VRAEPSEDRWNWSHNIEFTAKFIERPETLTELKQAIVDAHDKVKVVGTTHCFNDIADTPGTHISLENFQSVQVSAQDPEALEVSFGAGVTYSMLMRELGQHGMALYSMPSLPHLNVVGSVMTGSHGSGTDNQVMAAYVDRVRYVDAHGKAVILIREKNAAKLD